MSLTTFVRRCLVVAALMFWQGGFTFYASIVVPVGQSVLGSDIQGQLTQRVTNFLNLAGLCALAVLAWEASTSDDPARWRRGLRWASWIGAAIALGLLAWLHLELDARLGPSAEVHQRRIFRVWHRAYLWVSTVQWAFLLAFTGLTLWAWSMEQSAGEPGKSGLNG